MTNKEAYLRIASNHCRQFNETPGLICGNCEIGLAIDALWKSDKYRWHDLDKDPNDIPERHHVVEVCTLLKSGEKGYAFSCLIGDNGGCEDGACSISLNQWGGLFNDEAVIAWREIEPFEEG